MSSDAASAHRRLLGLLDGVSERLENPEDLTRPKKVEKFLHDLRGQIDSIKDVVRDLSPSIQQSRFAALSTRVLRSRIL